MWTSQKTYLALNNSRIADPDADFVDQDLVRKIENISNKLVIHAAAVGKIRSGENRIADIFAHIRFNRLYNPINR